MNEFCLWYTKRHSIDTSKSVLITCLCGYFHTYPKKAESLFKEMMASGLVTEMDDRVRINLSNNEMY